MEPISNQCSDEACLVSKQICVEHTTINLGLYVCRWLWEYKRKHLNVVGG